MRPSKAMCLYLCKRMSAATLFTVKTQTWAEDLRLPCLTEPSDTNTLLAELSEFRKPSIPFQSKHVPALKRNVWAVLQRPTDRTRSGLLVVWPARQVCVYISGDPTNVKRPHPRVALLRLRVDPQMLTEGTGITVFAATLSGSLRRLWIEDTLVWQGRGLLDREPFSMRWRLVQQWVDHTCIADSRLLGGVEMEPAQWQPLSALRPEGVWELQGASGRRLLWIANRRGPETPKPMADTIQHEGPLVNEGPLVAIATREDGPDQWALGSADGVALGRALIRRLEISAALRAVKGKVARLRVAWNPIFKKWEAQEIVTDPISHSSFFAEHNKE